MKSPFPGMDPYIEARGLWEGFHNHFVEAIYRAISRALPPGYTADTAVRTYIVVVESEGKNQHLAKPDIVVTSPEAGKKPRKKKGSVVLAETEDATEPVVMQAFIAEEFRETFVEIYAEHEERFLVTCIEVLSPSNKRPSTEGWQQYEEKRQALLLGRANFIELDLLRGGRKMPMLSPWPVSPYTLLVCRARNAPSCKVWPAHVGRRLPIIPVPLFDRDPDLSLDLQPLLEDVYEVGRYHELIDYKQSLTPPLPDADAAWLRDSQKTRKGKQ